MPTGYTAGVADGRIATFEAFVWECARGMGALVTLRDDTDAPIPDRFEVEPYHAQQIAKLRATLAEAEAWTADEAQRRADEEHSAETKAHRQREQKRAETEARYRTMLAAVEAWQPPTPDHVDFRTFMREQLAESIKWDCGDLRTPGPERKTGAEYRHAVMKAAAHSLRYHTEEQEKEAARVESRNRWLAALRASVKPVGR